MTVILSLEMLVKKSVALSLSRSSWQWLVITAVNHLPDPWLSFTKTSLIIWTAVQQPIFTTWQKKNKSNNVPVFGNIMSTLIGYRHEFPFN